MLLAQIYIPGWLTMIETLVILTLVLGIIYYYFRMRESAKDGFSNIFSSSYPANPDIGIQPLILRNDEELPVIPINTTPLGTAGYFTARCLRKLVYPLDPIQTFSSQEQILATLEPDQLAIIREHVLLDSGLAPEIRVLAPAYYETIICLANKYSPLLNIVDILLPKKDGTKNVIGVLQDSVALFEIVCKNRNIRLGQADTEFTVIKFPATTDLMVALGNRTLDACFLVTHPKDTVLQTYCNGNQTRLLDIEPDPEEGIIQSPVPYNPDDLNSLLVFRESIKRDVSWIFHETMSVDKLPNASLSALKGASRATGDVMIERVVYNTYKVRSLIIYKAGGGLILNDDLKNARHMPGLVSRLVRQYQSINRAFNSWNELIPSVGKKRVSSNNKFTSDETMDNVDLGSFDFNQLATVPAELKISVHVKVELESVGLIKQIETTGCSI